MKVTDWKSTKENLGVVSTRSRVCRVFSPPEVDRTRGRGDLTVMYPKPYSIY